MTALTVCVVLGITGLLFCIGVCWPWLTTCPVAGVIAVLVMISGGVALLVWGVINRQISP